MKKMYFAAIAVVGFSAIGMAQQQVKFGPKAGVNFANLSGTNDSEMKIGFHVGAVAEIKFNDKFSIQPELLYSSQGAKYTSLIIPNGTLDHKLNNDYINIPIMAKYYIVEGFSVELGPQIGFLVKSEEKVEGSNFSKTVDSKDFYKSTEFGIGVGLAYDLPMGLFVNGRYNLGLSDIRENTGGDAVKNAVIQIGVGYKFD